MSDRDALFAAILADPDDDLPRLVYADWLEENGRPADVARAQFIRLQIEMSRIDPLSDRFPQDYYGPSADLAALARQWLRAWLAELPTAVAAEVWKRRPGADALRRGFLESVQLPPEVFAAVAPELFAAAPVVRVHFHTSYRDINRLLGDPHLGRLRAVRLTGSWDADRLVRRLCKWSPPAGVGELDLSGCGVTDAGAFHLAAAEPLGGLSTLRLRDNLLSRVGVEVLAGARALALVARLDVTGNPGVRTGRAALQQVYGPRLVF
jgi:uncharacterized protein (TIGR02996 family)